jgi:hypothetical protein
MSGQDDVAPKARESCPTRGVLDICHHSSRPFATATRRPGSMVLDALADTKATPWQLPTIDLAPKRAPSTQGLNKTS